MKEQKEIGTKLLKELRSLAAAGMPSPESRVAPPLFQSGRERQPCPPAPALRGAGAHPALHSQRRRAGGDMWATCRSSNETGNRLPVGQTWTRGGVPAMDWVESWLFETRSRLPEKKNFSSQARLGLWLQSRLRPLRRFSSRRHADS
jgi:hypothetical protein